MKILTPLRGFEPTHLYHLNLYALTITTIERLLVSMVRRTFCEAIDFEFIEKSF